MKIKYLITIIVALFVCSSGFAVVPTATQIKLNKLQNELNQLQSQVYILKKQVRQQHQYKSKAKYMDRIKHKHTTKQYADKVSLDNVLGNSRIAGADSQIAQLVGTEHRYGYFNDSVVIAPYTERSTFNTGSELLINSPSINEDAKLLLRRYIEHKRLAAVNEVLFPFHPRLLLSGKLAGEVMYEHPYTGASSTDINLTSAELNAFVEISPWVNGFMALTYENLPSSSPRRISNSRVYLDRGFIIIGDFNRSPIYGSIGQMYVPFGRYGSNMVSFPLTYFIGKTKARAILVGIAPQKMNAPYARLFIFKGDSRYGNHKIAKNGGIDLGILHDVGKVNAEAGVSYIMNIADANGMQRTGIASTTVMPRFTGFDTTISTPMYPNPEVLVHGVPGIDLYGNIGISSINLLGEFVSATRSFNPTDLSFYSMGSTVKGAKPSAYNFEAAYIFHFFGHPSSLAIGYAGTQQALGLNVPEKRYDAVFSMTVLNNTKASLEYRHDINYGKNKVATGKALPAFIQPHLGKTDNAVTAEMDVYF